MPYAQINLAVDLFLIAVLSFTLLPKYPKFIIGLFALYLIPWIFPLPASGGKPKAPPVAPTASYAPVPSAPATGQAPSYDQSPGVQIYFDPSANPQETLAQTENLYKQVLGMLGAATGTTAPNAPTVQNLNSITAAALGDRSTRLGTSMENLQITPASAWFYIRLFWLTAALLLWIQNYFIGTLALVPSLVPIFYLARALPLAYETIKGQPWMQRASQTVTDEQAGNALIGQYSSWFAAALIALPTFLIILLFWRQIRGKLSRSLNRFLEPHLYQVRFNGHLMNFQKDGKDLVIEGLRFQASRMVQDRKRPEIWRLGSGTEIEFVRRESNPVGSN